MKLAVIGAGTMGSGIGQFAATAGWSVKLYDLNQEALQRPEASLEKIMDRLMQKGRIDADEKARIEGNIEYVGTLKKLKEPAWSIEAIAYKLEVNSNVLSALEKYV